MRGSIKKEKNGTYTYCVYAGIDENGKKKYKRKRGFKGQHECEAALAQEINMITKGTILVDESTKVSDYMDYWLKGYKTNISETTYARYEQFVRDIKKYLGNYKLTQLKPLIIQNFYEKLLSERKLEPSSVVKVHRMLNLALKMAVGWQLIINNPCEHVKAPKANTKHFDLWSLDEIEDYMELLKNTEFYKYAFIALKTGMRIGEMLALTWDDVDLVYGTITINKTLQYLNGIKKIKPPKTKKSNRTIPIDEKTVKFLKLLKAQQKELKLKTGISYKYVFSNPEGEPMSPVNVSGKLMHRALEKYDIPAIRFHDFRHLHATLLLKAGVNPKIVSERLGHSTIAITLDIYSEVIPDMQREAIEKIKDFV